MSVQLSGVEGAGQITVDFKWEGLVQQARDLLVPLEDYLESLPEEKYIFCAPLFAEEIKKMISERAHAREIAKAADDVVLSLPPNWRLRDVPDSFYLREHERAKPFDPEAPLPSHIEMRFNDNMRKYYVNHQTRETSFDPRGGDLKW